MKARIVVFVLLLTLSTIGVSRGGYVKQPPLSFSQDPTRTIGSWLDFKFDSSAPLGDPRNPAVIVSYANQLFFPPLLKEDGVPKLMFVPADRFQQLARAGFPSLASGATDHTSNVKSFDGFNAIDFTGILRNLPSEMTEIPDAAVRKARPQKLDEIRKLLRDGDIVLGSHFVNYLTWGRFNHVGMVLDAERGGIAESTAAIGTDKPGVSIVNWKAFAEGFAHIGVVRVKGLTPEKFSRLKQWIDLRKGRPYGWPLLYGLDKSDQSRFYCSQLIWLAFREVMEIDLDVDKGVLVFPDDIYYSKDFVDVIVP